MRNKTAKIPFVLSVLVTGGAVVLRLVQLLFFTDSATGLVTGAGETYSYWIYGLMLVCMLLCLRCALLCRGEARAVPDEFRCVWLGLFSYLLAGGFFVDFIHQCYNGYDFAEHTAYMSLNVLAPMLLVGVFALLSCFYFFAVGLTYFGKQYDFRCFRWFHFVTVLWALTRLLGILEKMVSVSTDTQTVCEFIYLVFLLMFFFSFITSAVSRRSAGRTVIFFGLAVFMFACLLSVPRLIVLISGRSAQLTTAAFSATTDLACGLFALAFVIDLARRNTRSAES